MRSVIRLQNFRTNNIITNRESVVLPLLVGNIAILSLASLLISLFGHLVKSKDHDGMSGLTSSLVFCITMLTLWILTKKGHYKLGVSFILILFWIASIISCIEWSFEFPSTPILVCLTIILGGILLEDTYSWLFSCAVIGSLITIGVAQVTHHIHPSFSWNNTLLESGDLYGLIILISLISLASWLSNHEMVMALKRANSFRLDLYKEKQNLELRVAERTLALETMQSERIIELQKFAEFGRLTSGLLHDLANPVSSASLSFQLMEINEERSILIDHARSSISAIENYIHTARNQIRKESKIEVLDTKKAIEQAGMMLSYRAKIENVELKYELGPIILNADPAKFQQLIVNLLTNAIDSYQDKQKISRVVKVRSYYDKQNVKISVQDNGPGISKNDIALIFEPLFTTKGELNGTGLGLALARRTVEDHLNGCIIANSSSEGTEFIITI